MPRSDEFHNPQPRGRFPCGNQGINEFVHTPNMRTTIVRIE